MLHFIKINVTYYLFVFDWRMVNELRKRDEHE